MPSAIVAGRYRLDHALKSSNGVDTYRGVDTLQGTDVVVKTIDQGFVHDAARLRFEHETQVLRELTGPGLTGLHDAGVADDHLFLVQPYVPGATLEDVLQRGPLPLLAVLRIGRDIATALDTAHGAGVCHRDVKPANVIVDGIDPVGIVTLIDFGFARSPWLDQSIRDDLVGTVRYLAPEAAGLVSLPADERSDLYALGVLLFEALAGRPLFPGPAVGDVLRQHLSMSVPELRECGVTVPKALDAVLQRLLRKEPAERYQSAFGLAADLSSLLEAVTAGDPDPRLVIGRLDRRRSLSDPAFVGRDAEVAALLSLVADVKAGGSGLVLLEADSGGGKSRLLSEVATQARNAGVSVLRGQGVAQAAQRPFTLLHGVAQDLGALIQQDGSAGQDVVTRLGDSAPTVARALPSLRHVLGVATDDDTAPEQFGEQRSLQALHLLLASLAAPDRPVLLVLDDCQWADRLTVRLLAEVFAAGSALPAHVGVVAAFRSEEVAPDHPLRDISQAVSVTLGPLTGQAMAQLAESMAGPLPVKAVATVVRLADGSPFMGAAVLRGLVECGALVSGSRGWSVDDDALQSVQTTRRSAAFLVRRLELLSEAALRVLSVGAVLGKEFDLLAAVELAEENEVAAAVLEEARSRRLLWVDERTGRCSFFHDKIREALLHRLDDPARQALHSKAADALMWRDDVSAAFDLAYHLDAAGRHQEALPHALRAAAQARGQHGLDSAVSHYRMAARGVAPDDTETRIIIAEGLGDVFVLQGVYREAESQLAAAHALVSDRLHAAALDGKLGELAFKQGDVPTARRHLEGAMARLGRPIPRYAPVLFLRLLWELLVQALHTAMPTLTTGRRSATGREEDFLAMRLHSRLAYLYWFYSGKVPCAWSHLRGMNLAERYPSSAELGQAYSEHAPVMTMLPWFGRALRYARRSLEIRRELGDIWGQGQSLNFTGVTLYAASRFDECEQACREAIRLLESTGDQWEVNTAGWNLALCLYRKGELVAAAEVARGVHASATAIGDQTSAGVSLSVWARASGGRVDARMVDDELARGSEDASTTTELYVAAGLCALRDDALELASQHLDAAAASIRQAGLRQEYVAPVAAWRATVARRQVEQAPAYHPAEHRRRLRRAARQARRARGWAISYRNNAPHALREAGLVASLRGRSRQTTRLLHRSIQVAELQGARYEAALSRLAVAEVATARGGPLPALEEALAMVRALEVRDPATDARETELTTISVFDRFSTLLSVGRTITAAPSAVAVENAIREAALSLLRGERCHLVKVATLLDEQLISESGEPIDAMSRTLLTRALAAGMPVVASDALADESESLLLSGIRSVLAAPIVVHGEAVSCFYVTHRQIGHLFGDEEIQLAAFVAALAGAAFEQLAGTETRFRSLAQNSSDVLTLVDRAGVVSYQSSAASHVFALPAVGLVGRPIDSWVHPDDLPRFTEVLAATAPGDEVRIECRFQHADGSYLMADTAVTNLIDDPAVHALVLNTRDVTDRRRLEDELRDRALHDALTGLPNRALFLERAQHALARRDPRPMVVCFLDLDDFKAVNDTLGHGAGDELLCALADRLVTCVRPGDTVARFGGDEFAILLEETDLPTALGIVERVLIATSEPVLVADTELVVHTSVGLAPSEGRRVSPDQLLAEADAAMYAAKGTGGHRFKVFAPAMRIASEERSRARTEIDRALVREEFVLHYQPIVDLRSGWQLGVEALIRWQHPERGLLLPVDFIDHAEESGQITTLGRWVLTAAALAATTLPQHMHISVNVSSRELQQPELVEQVAEALQTSGLTADRLVLEITETAAVSDVHGAIARLTALKALGLRLALDDFGTGYSSLSYLRKFPVDYLKIDRSFVTGLARSEEDRAIVRGVVDMAHALGLQTIAEGVEVAVQREILVDMGCDLAQGHLWQRAVPLDDLPSRSVVRQAPDPAQPDVGGRPRPD